METRRLGRTDLLVTPVGLGCWQFSGGRGLVGAFWPDLPQAECDAIVKAALDGEINWFDTAEVYGWGRSEEALAAALKAAGRRNGDVLVATKWWPTLRTAAHLRRTVAQRLSCLGGFAIDLHQVHQPASLSTVKAQMNAMADLAAAGRIRHAGVSNFGASRMRAAHAALAARGLPLASNQVVYSLLNRRIERNGVMQAAKELGITIIAYSPLAQGLLSGKFHEDPSLVKGRPGPRKWMGAFGPRGLERSRPVVDAVKAIAAAHGATPSQVALAWLLQFHGETVVVIPGATKARHAEEAAGAQGLRLSPAEQARLDELSRTFL
jgi:aryl-alcohol dehydrogenase-like predicted oxidoreductase